jgi:hypothetical protein
VFLTGCPQKAPGESFAAFRPELEIVNVAANFQIIVQVQSDLTTRVSRPGWDLQSSFFSFFLLSF